MPLVVPVKPLLTSGVDYAGSISLRLETTRSKTIRMGYIAFSVCFVKRIVHIEVVISLTKE
jgi:hypothetical protein